MTLHPHAAGLIALLDARWSQKIWRAGVVLCLPVIGWPAILGYRARFVRHLFSATPDPLPDWQDGLWGYVREGLWAMSVIFAYLAPLYITVAWLAVGRGFTPGPETAALALGFVALPIFSTMSFPVGAVLLARAEHLTPTECSLAMLGWAALIFFVPAAFLQVTLHGRHRYAFAVWRTVPFVVRNLRAYASAWWYSGLMSLTGHLFLPLAPWGVVWSYLGILALFNEVLAAAGMAPGNGWLQQAIADPRFRRRKLGRFEICDATGRTCRAVEIGPFAAPLWRAKQ